MKRREFLVGALGTAAALGLAPKAQAQEQPSILFLLADQWRAQAFGFAGDPNVRTPRIDAFAAESVNFTNAVSCCPVCTPYRAALLTGRYPTSTGMFLNDVYLPAEERCMAEIFRDAGYATGYVGKWHLDGHGRDSYIPPARRQGFGFWRGAECTHNYNHSHYYADDDATKRYWEGYDAYAQTKAAQACLRDHAQGGAPFLLVVSFGGPHFPHATAPEDFKALYPAESIQLRPNVPESFQERARLEAVGYYGHCTALDTCIGQLLDTLDETGIAENTMVVFTSDHGEMLGSQGQPPQEKQRPWDESVCVPFLLRWPKGQAGEGRIVKTPLNTPDILPTLLTLAGVALPPNIEGESLAGHVRGAAEEQDRAALIMNVSPFAGYFAGHEYRGIRTATHTYVRNLDGPWLLYNNIADPYQQENLVGQAEHAALQTALDIRLKQALRNIGDDFRPRAEHQAEWGYEVGKNGIIPYQGEVKMQTPKRPVQE